MPPAAKTIELSCPAKVNLSLAVLGQREDGFHGLHSVVSQLELGDTLRGYWDPDGRPEEDATRFLWSEILIQGCQQQEIPERENTVFKAIQLYRQASQLSNGAIRMEIEKHIPPGAGLGGGSSDAVAALKAIDMLLEGIAAKVDLMKLSAAIGSDCPLFFADGPVVMEGRGEVLSALDEGLAKRFKGKCVILFKPAYSINTAEAYRRMAAGEIYSGSPAVMERMLEWENGEEALPPAWNEFEKVCFNWIPDLAIVLRRLRSIHESSAL